MLTEDKQNWGTNRAEKTTCVGSPNGRFRSIAPLKKLLANRRFELSSSLSSYVVVTGRSRPILLKPRNLRNADCMLNACELNNPVPALLVASPVASWRVFSRN